MGHLESVGLNALEAIIVRPVEGIHMIGLPIEKAGRRSNPAFVGTCLDPQGRAIGTVSTDVNGHSRHRHQPYMRQWPRHEPAPSGHNRPGGGTSRPEGGNRMILVTGPTGNLGPAVLDRLRLEGAAVRAIAHTEASRATIERYGAEAVDADFDEPGTLEAAMAGCDRVFLLSPLHPAQAQREMAAIDAAKQAGIGHVVALSIMGADRASPVAFCRWHAAIDEHLAGSGLGYTVLRPAGFMQFHLMPVQTVMAANSWFGMTGDGAAAYVDVNDVAAAAVGVLTSSGHGGQTYELTGPEAITLHQAAVQLGTAIGRPVAYIDLPAEAFRANLVKLGLPPWLTDAVVTLYGAIRDGHAATVTNSVEQLTGRPAHSYREMLGSHTDAFVTT